ALRTHGRPGGPCSGGRPRGRRRPSVLPTGGPIRVVCAQVALLPPARALRDPRRGPVERHFPIPYPDDGALDREFLFLARDPQRAGDHGAGLRWRIAQVLVPEPGFRAVEHLEVRAVDHEPRPLTARIADTVVRSFFPGHIPARDDPAPGGQRTAPEPVHRLRRAFGPGGTGLPAAEGQ